VLILGRLPGVCEPCHALAAGGYGARTTGAEALGGADAPDTRCRGTGLGGYPRAAGGAGRCAESARRPGCAAAARCRNARDHGHGSRRGGRGTRRLGTDHQARLAARQGLFVRSPRGRAVSDSEALEWLDRLLAADEPERQAQLETLANSHPEMHARLQRLLASALAPDKTRMLAGPVLEGVARLSEDAMRALQPGDVLAGYRLIREIGRGGMSVVWLAERADGVVKRNVALKMPMFMLQGAGDAERFARERDALAALSHPHVARLYDAGVLPSGQPFIVLEHVEGAPLTVHCDAQRLDLRARLRLFLQVLAAVEHAHKHLVVHRDLKPSNILVDGDGQVKLLDFGIAKLLGASEGAAPLTE